MGFFEPSLPSELLVMTQSTENQIKLVKLAYSRSSATLQAQATIASASDQRALVFSTLSVAAAALVFGALSQPTGSFAAIGAAVLFCFAALLSAVSAMPGKLHGFTSKYSELRDAVERDLNIESVLVGLCSNNDEYLEKNEQEAVWRAHCYRFAVFVFLIGVSWSLISFTLVHTGSPK